MHLAINATEIGRQRGGNESYLSGLLRGLADAGIPDYTSVLMTETGIAQRPEPGSSRGQQVNIGRYHRLYFNLWQQTAVLRQIRPDWYLSTFFLPPVVSCRTAVLVHDYSFRVHPEYFPPVTALYMRVLTASAIQQADRVIALSHFTREEILRFHPDAEGKTRVVYPGIDQSFSVQGDGRDMERLQRLGLAPGYILALGNIHPRKNHSRLLEAYVLLKKDRQVVPPMVWAGTPRWESSDLLDRARDAGVILPGYIHAEDLPTLYRQATMLVYPSLYEGFGLPPVEAMACGTPSIVSNTTSLPEAVGGAALLIDPANVVTMADAMARLLEDAELHLKLRQAGLEHARRFVWAETAQRLISVL